MRNVSQDKDSINDLHISFEYFLSSGSTSFLRRRANSTSMATVAPASVAAEARAAAQRAADNLILGEPQLAAAVQQKKAEYPDIVLLNCLQQVWTKERPQYVVCVRDEGGEKDEDVRDTEDAAVSLEHLPVKSVK